jgi:3-phenylpropionate/trans-cinnamate dioxygenase ferredoxin subunit
LVDSYVKVADISQISAGQNKVVYFRSKEIVLINYAGRFYAVDNRCPHRQAPLCAGVVQDHVVRCPWHGARFDLKSGRGLPGPHRADIRSYRVRIDKSDLLISET